MFKLRLIGFVGNGLRAVALYLYIFSERHIGRSLHCLSSRTIEFVGTGLLDCPLCLTARRKSPRPTLFKFTCDRICRGEHCSPAWFPLSLGFSNKFHMALGAGYLYFAAAARQANTLPAGFAFYIFVGFALFENLLLRCKKADYFRFYG